MAKNWWFRFDFRVWRTDSNLRRCSLETRGFWLECLCAMYEADKHIISGSYEELGWLIGCSPEVAARCILELKRTETADVTLGNGNVTLMSRRLQRDVSAREQSRLRMQKMRGNGDVTPLYKTSLNKVISNKKEIREEEELRDAPQAVPTTDELEEHLAQVDEQIEALTKPRSKRGSRLPDEFPLTEKMREYAAKKRPDIDVELETEKFRNHWHTSTGRNATKLRWDLAWNNWILNARRNGNGQTSSFRQQRDAEVVASRNRREQIRRELDDRTE